jgi:hypothetical protein
MGTAGKALAGLGCLMWLLCGILGLVLAFGSGIIGGIIGYDYAGFVSMGGYGSMCCSSLGFIMFVVGVILVLVGGGSSEPTE